MYFHISKLEIDDKLMIITILYGGSFLYEADAEFYAKKNSSEGRVIYLKPDQVAGFLETHSEYAINDQFVIPDRLKIILQAMV
jgi:hypothetical protein